MDMVYPPLEEIPGAQVYTVAEEMAPDSQIMLRVTGTDFDGNAVDKTVMLPLSNAETGADRLFDAGLELREEDGKVLIDNIVFGSAAERQQLDFDYEIASVQRETDRPAKHWMYLPALLLLGLVIGLQRRRARAAA
jgi:hypothetical protein